MQSVIETPAYLAAAKEEGMTVDEMMSAVDLVAANPRAGDLIAGSGGCRKVRVGGKGRGKSGGYRVVTFFAAKDVPVFFSLCCRRDRGPLLEGGAQRNEAGNAKLA